MRVRPDIVKLDRALTRDIHRDAARMALVESFVRFARDVGATVCAEGIESLDELAVLADLDVQWGQGFVLARPRAAVDRGLADRRRGLPGGARRQPSARCPTEHHPIGASDRRLVHLSARLAARSHAERPGERARADRRRARLLEDLPLGLPRATRPRDRDPGRERRALRRDDVFTVDGLPAHRARCSASRRRCRRSSATPTATRARSSCCSQLGERSLLMVPVVSRGESARDHRGLPHRRARLVAGRDQPRAGDREPVRVGDPDAVGRAPGRDAAAERRRRRARA